MAPRIRRRQFLEIAGAATAAAAAANGMASAVIEAPLRAADQVLISETRREAAYRIRHEAALHHYHLPPVAHPTNGDEERSPNRIASYSKALPHNELGEVDPAA